MVRERAASAAHFGWSVPQGARLKLRAPFHTVFFAWGSEAEAEAWLTGATPAPTSEQRSSALNGMAFARRHGFSTLVRNPQVSAQGRSPEQVFGGEQTEFPVTVLSELDPDKDYAVSSVTAPVFDANGQVAFALGLTGFARPVVGAEIERMGRRLRDACDRVTAFVGGHQRQPQLAPA